MGRRSSRSTFAGKTSIRCSRFNRRFAVAPAQAGTAFVLTTADLDRIFSIHQDRVVGNDNTTQMGHRGL